MSKSNSYSIVRKSVGPKVRALSTTVEIDPKSGLIKKMRRAVKDVFSAPLEVGFRIVEKIAPPYKLVWPSGAGSEIATLVSKKPLWDLLSDRAKITNTPIDIYEVEEDGISAIVLHGFASSPISFVVDEELSPDLISVVADENVSIVDLKQYLTSLFGRTAQLHFHF